MTNLLTYLQGKKTYGVALLMFAYAIAGLALGEMPEGESIQLILEALSIGGLRAGIAKL
jgi:hypothetical protein